MVCMCWGLDGPKAWPLTKLLILKDISQQDQGECLSLRDTPLAVVVVRGV